MGQVVVAPIDHDKTTQSFSSILIIASRTTPLVLLYIPDEALRFITFTSSFARETCIVATVVPLHLGFESDFSSLCQILLKLCHTDTKWSLRNGSQVWGWNNNWIFLMLLWRLFCGLSPKDLQVIEIQQIFLVLFRGAQPSSQFWSPSGPLVSLH